MDTQHTKQRRREFDDRTASAEAEEPARKPSVSEQWKKATGSSDEVMLSRRIGELDKILPREERDNGLSRRMKKREALTSLVAMDPQDEFERMLCVQLIGLNEMILGLFSMANAPDVNIARHKYYMTTLNKLVSMQLKIQEQLNKHRRNGKQTMVVQHVNVAAGANAIVGNVNSENARSANKHHSLIEESENQPLDMDLAADEDTVPSRKERAA